MSEGERERLLKLWKVEAASYNFSVSISSTMVQAYAIRVLRFDVELLGTMVLVQLGTLGAGYLLGSLIVPLFRVRRMALWKVFGTLNRCLWALLGFSHKLPEEHRVWAFLAMLATSQLSASIAGVAAGDVGADLVGRGRALKFFSSLNSWNLVANSLGLALATAVFTLLPSGEERYVVAYSVALASSVVSSALLAMLKDVELPSSGRSPRDILNDMAEVVRSRDSSLYLRTVALFTFAVNLPGALWGYYLLNVLGGDESWFPPRAIAANLCQSLGFRLWGKVSGKVGLRKTLYLGIALTTPIPAVFTLLPSLPGQVLLEAYSGFAWAAYHLATNIYTLYLPRKASRATFIAAVNLATNTLASVASRLGASVAATSLLAMSAVFYASTLGRVAAALYARRTAPELATR